MDFKTQSEHSELCPDTSSFVGLSSMHELDSPAKFIDKFFILVLWVKLSADMPYHAQEFRFLAEDVLTVRVCL